MGSGDVYKRQGQGLGEAVGGEVAVAPPGGGGKTGGTAVDGSG